MTPVLDVVTSTQPVVYSDVLGLDKKIRQFAIPHLLQMLDREGYTPSDMMRQAMTTCTREVGEHPILLVISSHARWLTIYVSAASFTPELLHSVSHVGPRIHREAQVCSVRARDLFKRTHINLGSRLAVFMGTHVKFVLYGVLV